MEITKKAKQQLTASPAIIDLQGIVKRFYIGKPNELEILHGIDLQVQEGQFVSIVGESGSGKSILLVLWISRQMVNICLMANVLAI